MDFMIETDVVSSAGEAIAKQAINMIDSANVANGWVTTNEDNFDFDSAKNIIASNLETCANKIKNTAELFNKVVTDHTDLQNSFQFDPQTGKQKTGKQTNQPKDEDNQETSATTANDPGVTSPSTRTASPSRPSNGNKRSNSIPVVPPVAPITPNVRKKEDEKTESKKENKAIAPTPAEPATKNEQEQMQNQVAEDNSTVDTSKDTPVSTESGFEVNTEINDVSYAAPKTEQLSEESKKLLEEAIYTNEGHAVVDGRYAIACSPEVGKVGDVIKITAESGQEREYIVGVNTVTSDNNNKLFFLVDNGKSSVTPLDFDQQIVSNSKNVQNLGNYQVLSASSAVTPSGEVGLYEQNTDYSDRDDLQEGDDLNG